jgi:hypothetical protein
MADENKILQHDAQQVAPRDEGAIKNSLIESNEDIEKRNKRSEILPLLYPQRTGKGKPYERYTLADPKPRSTRPSSGFKSIKWQRIASLGLILSLTLLAITGTVLVIISIIKSLNG